MVSKLRKFFIFSALILYSAFICEADINNIEQLKPNVIIILADDLGYGDLSCYGAIRIKTPNIDSLTKNGIIFTDAHSPSSVCTPSRYNLLTGRYAWRTWVKSGTVWANDPLLIEPKRFTLPKLFKQQGYTTACIGKWHLGFGTPEMEGWDDLLGPDFNGELKPGPLEVGFDYFWGFPHVGQLPHIIIENYRVVGLQKDDPIRIIKDPRKEFQKDYLNRPRIGAARLRVKGGNSAYYKHENLSSMLTLQTIKWLNSKTFEEPFFLFLSHRNIHAPMIPDSTFIGQSNIGKRGDFILELDHSVGEIIKTLKSKGIYENTIIIFTSDNGGVLKYEPINYPHDNQHYINGPLRGQKTTVYEGGHRIPFIIHLPNIDTVSERKDSSLITLTDLMATFADYFDVELPEDSGEDSFSFLGTFFAQKDKQVRRNILINDSYSGLFSIRKENWKYIDGEGGGGTGEPRKINSQNVQGQLYNLSNDISETKNLYSDKPDLVKELRQLLITIQKEDRTAPVIKNFE